MGRAIDRSLRISQSTAKVTEETQAPLSNLAAVVIVAAVLGFLSITLPPYIIPGKKLVAYEAPLFPFIRTAIENLSISPTAGLLVFSGGVIGYLKPQKWRLLGFSTIVLFPIASIAELIVDPTSHNLWPLEFFIYGMLSIPAILGALVGSKLKILFFGK